MGLAATRVVLHTQRNRPPRFSASPHLVELEAHESLDESALAACLLAYYQDGRRIEGLLEILRQAMQQIISLV